MSFLKRFFPDYAGPNRRELPRLLAMMGLFFLVVCSVGILRPIKNALALETFTRAATVAPNVSSAFLSMTASPRL